jgi:APA family basic amino acid/polyamine antiporter
MQDVRPLGFVSATALVVANMIGTGVFTTSGFLLADLGSPWIVILVWLLGGCIALLGALCYGALARVIPESGGEYVFLSRTLHPALGYVAGLLSLLVGFSAPIAAAAYAFGQYLAPWTGDTAPQVAGTMLLLAFYVLHALHVKRGAWVQNVAVIAKVALIAAFIVVGAARLPAPAPPDAGSFTPTILGAVAVSLVWVMFSYSGWNAAVYVASEVRDPARTLPRALWSGTLIVAALYVALNAVFVFASPAQELAGKLEVGQIAAQALGGPGWARAVTAIVALALISSVSSMMMAGPRVYAKMAEDGYLPRVLAPATGQPPRLGLLLQFALALLLLWSATFESLLTYIGFTLGLGTAATVVGLVRLRMQSSQRGEKLAVPGWPWVPGLFLFAISAITVLTIGQRPAESLYGFATLAGGWLLWWFSYRRQGAAGSATPPA